MNHKEIKLNESENKLQVLHIECGSVDYLFPLSHESFPASDQSESLQTQ